MTRLFLLAALALLGLAAPAGAQTFPKFTGFVVDDAIVLSPTVEADLTAKLGALQRDTSGVRRPTIATSGLSLEDYGYGLSPGACLKVFNTWRSCRRAHNPAPARARLELEAARADLTDPCSVMIPATWPKLGPATTSRRADGGADTGSRASLARGGAGEAYGSVLRVHRTHRARRSAAAKASSLLAALWIVFFFVILPMLRGAGGRRTAGGAGWATSCCYVASQMVGSRGGGERGFARRLLRGGVGAARLLGGGAAGRRRRRVGSWDA